MQVENGLGEDRIHYTIDLILPPVAPTIRDLSPGYNRTLTCSPLLQYIHQQQFASEENYYIENEIHFLPKKQYYKKYAGCRMILPKLTR